MRTLDRGRVEPVRIAGRDAVSDRRVRETHAHDETR